MSNQRQVHSYLNSRKSWVVYGTGTSQLAVQQFPNNKPMNSASGSIASTAYRDTAYWGKDKMTYEELTVAWDAFNRSEELKALNFTQSEAFDRKLEQVFENVRIECEDLDGLKPPCKSSSKSSRVIGRCRQDCGCQINYPSKTERIPVNASLAPTIINPSCPSSPPIDDNGGGIEVLTNVPYHYCLQVDTQPSVDPLEGIHEDIRYQ